MTTAQEVRALTRAYISVCDLPGAPLGSLLREIAGRADFADPARRLVIEVDGLAFHNGQESFIRDQRRQRRLQSDGWLVVRFAAKEALEDPHKCLSEAVHLMSGVSSA